MAEITPGVVLNQGFKQHWQVGDSYYAHALDYTDREEATQQPPGYEEYQEYMANEDKTTGLFTAFDDQLDQRQKKWYKSKFQSAYENKGLLWQPIISFTDEWLEEQGILGNDAIDEQLIKEATRNAVKVMLAKEQLTGRIYWTGAIHYNTDNIHVHISMVEKDVQRERGVFKQSTIDSAKSKIVSTLTDRTPEQQRINELLRKEILERARTENYKKRFKKQFVTIASNIPKSQYGRLSHLEKQIIDELSLVILKEKYPWSYQALQGKLKQEEHFYQKTYGSGERHLYEHYKTNREAELMSKLGNTILKQAKAYRQDEKKQWVESRQKALEKLKTKKSKLAHQKQARFERKGRRFRPSSENKQLSIFLDQMRRKAEFTFKKNLIEYERMEKEAERENER